MSTAAVSRTVSTDKSFYGVYSAIVTQVNDDAGKEGRVKIKYPWFDDQMESDWCRVAQIYAGNGYGSFILPEVGDEVLVAYDHGDMRMPIVLAGLYNGQDKPVTYRSSTQDQKLLRTKGGSELLFDDSQGKQRVRLKTPAGHTADLSDVDKKIVIQTSGGQSVALDDSANKITIQTGSASVTIDGSSGNITVAGKQIVLQGSGISLGPTSSSTHPVPFGDQLLEIFNSHTHICTAPASPSGPPVPILLPSAVSLKTLTS
jgi:uncharacterized protein involved in type VI secretion and phage assembly